MTHITKEVSIQKTNDKKTGQAYGGVFSFCKTDLSGKYQRLLLDIQTDDPEVKKYIAELLKTEEINILLDVVPQEQTSDLQFDRLSESGLKNFSTERSCDLFSDFKRIVTTAYLEKDIKAAFLQTHEFMLAIASFKDIFNTCDLIVMVGDSISHPLKGDCYLMFSERDGEMWVEAIPVSYFFSTIHHFWIIVKTENVIFGKDLPEPEVSFTGTGSFPSKV